MTPEQFCYWLQGFKELHPSHDSTWSRDWHPDGHQWKIIMAHLDTVFNKVTHIPNQIGIPVTPNPLGPQIIC